MVFLLTVAWDAWPAAVLVMSCVAGVMVSLQYLVFGFHRVGNGVVWVGRSVVRRGTRGRPAVSPHVQAQVGNGGGRVSMQGVSRPSTQPMEGDAKRSGNGDEDEDEEVRMPEPDITATGIVGEASGSGSGSGSGSAAA